MAKQIVRTEAHCVSKLFNMYLTTLKHFACHSHAFSCNPVLWRQPSRSLKVAEEGPPAHSGDVGQLGDIQIDARIGADMLHRARQAVNVGIADQASNKLALTTLAVAGHHHSARGRIGGLIAQIAADHVEQHVDSRSCACRGDDVTIVDIEHRLVVYDRTIDLGEAMRMAPVRRRATFWPATRRPPAQKPPCGPRQSGYPARLLCGFDLVTTHRSSQTAELDDSYRLPAIPTIDLGLRYRLRV